mmetsp:Transcript_30681/g.57779  ORF Transcript_30681/g.57779 Transcript_30681/m.57779 type:complete len:126 (+) Transcript_30681:336-713(+)
MAGETPCFLCEMLSQVKEMCERFGLPIPEIQSSPLASRLTEQPEEEPHNALFPMVATPAIKQDRSRMSLDAGSPIAHLTPEEPAESGSQTDRRGIGFLKSIQGLLRRSKSSEQLEKSVKEPSNKS